MKTGVGSEWADREEWVGGKGSRMSTGSGPECGTWECRKGSEGSSLPLTIKKKQQDPNICKMR